MARPETILQRQLREYLGAKGFVTVAVPNGSVLSGDKIKRARQMASLKKDGLTPGFPDLLVYGRNGRIGHIEVKTEGNYQEPSQKVVQGWLTEFGHLYAVCRSLLDVDETLARWGWA